MKIHFLYLTFLLALTQASDVSERLIGGSPAEVDSHPYHAYLLIISGKNRSYCSGALISSSYVLTTQYCLAPSSYSSELDRVIVKLGVHNLEVTEDWQQEFNVTSSAIYLHNGYKANGLGFLNDLALLKLPKPAKLSKYVQLVALPKYSEKSTSFEDEIATFEGFGITNSDPLGSLILQTTKLTVISLSDCRQYHGTSVTNQHLCTRGKNNGEPVGLCKGDRGGPLVIKRKLIGIGSFFSKPCEKGEPSVFVSISKYLDWINSVTGIKIQMN